MVAEQCSTQASLRIQPAIGISVASGKECGEVSQTRSVRTDMIRASGLQYWNSIGRECDGQRRATSCIRRGCKHGGYSAPCSSCRKDGDRSMKKKDHPLVASQCLWRRRFAPPNSGCLAAARGRNFVCSHTECLGRCRCTGLVRGHADGFKGHVARGEAMGISADRHVRGEVRDASSIVPRAHMQSTPVLAEEAPPQPKPKHRMGIR